MAFLPGSGVRLTKLALVTEKEGKLWLVDTATGKRQAVSGVPTVNVAGQGGLGDVVVHPDFAANRRVYLSFVEKGAGGERRGARLWHAGHRQRHAADGVQDRSGASRPRSTAMAISATASPSGPTGCST